MNNHLSHDQMSRCLLGQASPEEEEHGHDCASCAAELIQFRQTVDTFQNVMKNWSEQEIVPRLKDTPNILSRQSWPDRPALRFAFAAALIAVLTIIPIYRQRGLDDVRKAVAEPRAEAEANADMLLMQEVTAHLARPLPLPMERVMALLPGTDASMINKTIMPGTMPASMPEREEVR